MNYLAEIEGKAAQVEECQATNIALRERLVEYHKVSREKSRTIANLEGKIMQMKQGG